MIIVPYHEKIKLNEEEAKAFGTVIYILAKAEKEAKTEQLKNSAFILEDRVSSFVNSFVLFESIDRK